jgi:hypothetical protein
MFFPITGKCERFGLIVVAASALALACGDASDNNGTLFGSGGPGGTGGTQDNAGGSSSGGSQSSSGGATSSSGGATSSSGNASSSGGASSSSGGTSSSSGASSGAVPPSFDVSLGAATLTGDLLDAKQTVVTVAPTNGFTGTVTLAVTAPADLTATFDKTSLDVTASAGASANLTVRSSKSGDQAFKVTATSGALNVSKDVTFTASKTLLITIPSDAEMNKGTTANPRLDAFGPSAGIVVHASVPLTLHFVNKDSTGHIVHAGGQNGFFHGDTGNPIPPDGMDKTRTITAAGNYGFYLHDQGPVTLGKLILQAQ